MRPSGAESIANVLMANRAPALWRVYVISDSSLENQIWIDGVERELSVMLRTRWGSTRLSADHQGSGRTDQAIQAARSLFDETEPFARSVDNFVEELNRNTSSSRFDPANSQISHVNLLPWLIGNEIEIIFSNLGGHSGVISIGEHRDRVHLHETGGLNRQFDAEPYAEAIHQLLADARRIIVSAEEFSRSLRPFLPPPEDRE